MRTAFKGQIKREFIDNRLANEDKKTSTILWVGEKMIIYALIRII